MKHSLFTAYQQGDLQLRNHIVMAPMTRSRATDSIPTELMAEYYAQRATAGLIISEGTPVSPMGHGYLWVPGIHTQEQVDGWRKVTDAVHQAGGKMFAQLWHVGRVSHVSLLPNGAAPEGPTDEYRSDVVCFAQDESGTPGLFPASPPVALNQTNIDRIIGEFVQAAKNAMSAGMDGIEIHGANSYLFDQFLNSVTNTRTDNYGGSPENRCRFLLETTKAVGQEIGFDKVCVRISPNGVFNGMPEDPENEVTMLYLVDVLNDLGVGFLHVHDLLNDGQSVVPEQLIENIRARFGNTMILCGGYTFERAQEALDKGLTDMVAFGVKYIANPDLVARFENQWPLNEANPNTFYGGGAEGLTDYPFHPQ